VTSAVENTVASTEDSTVPIQHRLLTVVVAVQAGWLIYLSSRGWFYQDDFALLAQAVHRGLTPGYLTQSVHGHLAPGVRLTFWVLAHTTRLQYAPTVALRVVLQAVATILLYRLLTVVSRSATVGLVVTAVYCASPLLVPGTLWLTTSTSLLPAQICVLVAYLACVQHADSGQLRWSALAGLALLVGVAFWEKAAVTAVLLVILSLGWLIPGRLRGRLWSLARDWRGWLLTLGPLAAFTVYFFVKGYGPANGNLAVHDALRLSWLQWSHSLWPAVIGAPWRWRSAGSGFVSVADPRPVTVILGQCAFAVLVVAGWRRNRWRSLLAWTLPLVSVVVGEVLVGLDRYGAFGDTLALKFSSTFDLAVPTALAIALALRRPSVERATPTQVGGEILPSDPASPSRLRWLAGVTCVALLIGSGVVSAIAWTSRWHASPSKAYVDTVVAAADKLGGSANLFDTALPPEVVRPASPNHHLSDLFALTTATVAFNQGLPQPQIVTAAGRIVPGSFRRVARAPVTNAFCPTLVKGVTHEIVHLEPAAPPGEYFLRIAYFEQRPALVTVTVRDRTGRVVPLRVDPTVEFDQQLGIALLPLSVGSPATVAFTSRSDATNICMSRVAVGAPVPAPR
jgi:hypothetical protein